MLVLLSLLCLRVLLGLLIEGRFLGELKTAGLIAPVGDSGLVILLKLLIRGPPCFVMDGI